MDNYTQIIKNHYKKEAKKDGLSPLSTMPDLGKRVREMEIIIEGVKQSSELPPPNQRFGNRLPNSQSIARRSYIDSKGLDSRSPCGIGNRKDNEYINVSLSSPIKIGFERGLPAQKVKNGKNIKVLDAGCGNGIALKTIRERFPSLKLFGIDFSKEMVDLAKSRNMDCSIDKGDICNTPYKDDFFDFIYMERVIQNILDWKDQKKALNEIYRILKKGCYFLMIEGFTDGFKNCNKARREVGLPPIKVAYHNLLLDKDLFLKEIENKFEVMDILEIPYNFLSSYDFIRLVFHPLVTKGKWIRNTEFVKFFGEMFPPIGNYSRTQAYLLRKR